MKRDLLQDFAIVGLTGLNGAGKTAVAVSSAIHDMKRGRAVYSTVDIRSAYGDSRPIRSLRELARLEDCTVLLDEVSVIFSSRSTMSLPAEMQVFLQTLRHRRVTVRWTAPGWMRADNLLRSVTQAVVNVVPLVSRRVAGEAWARPRLVVATVLDASSGTVDSAPDRKIRRGYYRLAALPAIGAYDTHADTPILGAGLVSGAVCVDCLGSTPKRPSCNPERHEHLGLPWYGSDPFIDDLENRRALVGGQSSPKFQELGVAGAEHLPVPADVALGLDGPDSA